MAIPTYVQGFPPDGSSLGNTKTQIRNNLDGTFQVFSVDHVNQNGTPSSQAGYHTDIHMVPQTGNPAAIPGYGQLYCRTITSVANDQALFYETGGGIIMQMTMNVLPRANARGYTYLPGGILIQWGTFTAVAQTATTLLFTTGSGINFPTACFGAWPNLQKLTSQSAQDVVYLYNFTASQFTYYSTSAGTRSVNWFAIGN